MKRVWTAAIVAVLVLLPIPFQTIEAPEWEVIVIDESHNAVSGVTVRESYKDYSAERIGGEEDRVTDEQGRVIFPEKKLRASGLSRIAALASSLTGGAHASFGRHAHVFAFGKCEGDSVKDGYVEDWTGLPSHDRSTIVSRSVKGN